MGSSSLYFSTLIIILIAGILDKSVNADFTEEIETICRKTEDYRYCLDFFYEMLDIKEVSFRRILGATIEGAKNKATRILSDIHRLRKLTYDEKDQDSLVICEHAYETLVKMFKTAEKCFYRHEYFDLVYELRGTRRGPSACDIAWSELNHMLSESNKEMGVLSAMALETANIMRDAKVKSKP